MEKRWCERIPVSFEVMLHYHGTKLAKCAVKNISLCGISLHSGPLAFHRNTSVQLQILDANYLEEGRDRINAVVVRNSPDSIGLMFSPTEPEILRALIRRFKKHDRRKRVPERR